MLVLFVNLVWNCNKNDHERRYFSLVSCVFYFIILTTLSIKLFQISNKADVGT